jgi:hypothetical protein
MGYNHKDTSQKMFNPFGFRFKNAPYLGIFYLSNSTQFQPELGYSPKYLTGWLKLEEF